MLHDAEKALNAAFDGFAKGLFRRGRVPDVTADALALLIRGLGVSGGAQVRVLFLLDEPDAAVKVAQRQTSRLRILTRALPPDALAEARPETDPAVAGALAGGLIETGRRLAGIPPLVDSLDAAGIAPRDWLRQSEEAEAPCQPLPGPSAPGRA